MSDRRFAWILVLMLILAACPAVAEDARTFVPTAQWEPPVIDESCRDTEPWLLVLKVAQEEMGYKEGPLSNQTKYGKWFSNRRSAWCAEFLTWCVNEADTRYGTEMLKTTYPWYGGSDEGAPWFKARGRLVSDNGVMPGTNEKQWLAGADRYMNEHEYVPYPGDYLWIFYYSRKQGTDHVAIVEGVSRNEDGSLLVHVIEGNNPDTVQRAEYALDYKLIYGYGTPVKRAYTNLRLYYTSDEVTLLARQLEALDYYKKPKAGYPSQMDKTLQTALYRFKLDQKLSGGKIMDLNTWNALNEALAEKGITLKDGE